MRKRFPILEYTAAEAGWQRELDHLSNPFGQTDSSFAAAKPKAHPRMPALQRFTLATAAALFLFNSSIEAQEISYVLRAPDAACLIKHHSDYLAVERDLFFVSLEECPSTARLAADSFSQNLAATPSFDQRDAAYDNLITLTRAHLACLGTLTPPTGDELYSFAPGECSLRLIDDGGAGDD